MNDKSKCGLPRAPDRCGANLAGAILTGAIFDGRTVADANVRAARQGLKRITAK